MGREDEPDRLVADMRPELQEGEFVFCTVSAEVSGHLGVEPIGWFREDQGITLVVGRGAADRAGLEYDLVFQMITLRVHSPLDAVGFLALVTGTLASAGVSVNTISAYYHDHLFVPTDDARKAMDLLNDLSREAGRRLRQAHNRGASR